MVEHPTLEILISRLVKNDVNENKSMSERWSENENVGVVRRGKKRSKKKREGSQQSLK